MLVDSYFKPEQVPWLTSATSIRRVLISGRHRRAAEDLKRMSVALGTVPGASALEVRSTTSPELHDRCLISSDGSVQLLGSSLNGVDKHLTALITPDVEVGKLYRDRYERLWSER